MPKHSVPNFCRGFLELYEQELRAIGYNFVGKMKEVRTSGNVPLYYLFFASRHPLGEKFWNETLKRVNEPELF